MGWRRGPAGLWRPRFINNRHGENWPGEFKKMRTGLKALGVTLGVSIGLATTAEAQYQRPTSDNPVFPQPEEERPQPKGAATVSIGGRTITISADFLKRYQALQAAVDANSGTIPTELAAANAAAKTPEERYLVATLQLKAATASKNEAVIGQALEALLASGGAPATQLPVIQVNLGKIYYNQKSYDRAAAAFESALKLQPSNAEATTLLAQTRQLQGRSGDALADLTKAIAQQKAAGEKPAESLYKRAVALAYESRQPSTVPLAREWIAAYPSVDSWRDGLRVYRNIYRPDEPVLLDVLRLARLTGALSGEGDYHRYGYLAASGVTSGEALAVIQEGVAAKQIDSSKKLFADIVAEATRRSAGQKGRLPQLAKDAMASPNARAALNAGDIAYSYGEFAQAAGLYRAALGKTGADKDQLNLRLGMALGRAGDKAAATAAFNSVGGIRAELAKYWLIWLNSQG
jgi:tetratricopeptide (TPR) repeat protein